MVQMRTSPPVARALCAVLLALLLGLRLLAPAGFMPQFDRGAVTIVPCPDAFGATAPAHRHGHHQTVHQPCPYAAAASLAAVPGDWAPLIAPALFGAVLLIGQLVVFAQRRRANERPHPTGPPFPA